MRTTSYPQDEKIKLRLNRELKFHVEACASEDGVSLSEYIRGLIMQDVRNRNARQNKRF